MLCSLEMRDAFKEIDELRADNKVLIEALEWIMPKVHQGNHEGEFEQCRKFTCSEYHKVQK